MIEFLVQMPNLELGFQIDLVVIFAAQTVARLGAILTHHDDRRLHSRQTGENQVEKNEWERIECSASEQHDVRADPHDDNSTKCNEKFPTATELGNTVGESLTEGEFFFELLLDIAREDFMLVQTLDNFLIERGKLAEFVF